METPGTTATTPPHAQEYRRWILKIPTRLDPRSKGATMGRTHGRTNTENVDTLRYTKNKQTEADGRTGGLDGVLPQRKPTSDNNFRYEYCIGWMIGFRKM
ncbi:hypothetical protein MTP99_012724 [Tenebrio molitor]|jgi:hypothetical protein|nr:hypothetical protein MTP99_012724 [Tenebrio molitor]